jgi:Family of unknown function (DUF6988)
MDLESLFERSNALNIEVMQVVALPLYDGGERTRVSDLLCSLAIEHAHGAQALLRGGLLPSALVIHRAQFEAVLRSIWAFYAATDGHVAKLAADLSVDSEQAAKNLPSASTMMDELAKKAPPEPYKALAEFKAYNWHALNSYAHAGVHPVQRHQDGYPTQLIYNALLNVNGLMVFAAMQAAILTGVPNLQKRVLAAADRYPEALRHKEPQGKA